MSLIVPANTGKTSHIAWQDITATNQVAGTPIVVNNGTDRKRSIRFFVKLGRRSGTAFTAGPIVRFECSSTDSGDADWATLFSHQMAVGGSIASTTLSAQANAGATSVTLTAATNVAYPDRIFLKGNTDAENELVLVRSTSGSTINLDVGTPVVATKANGNAVTDQAEFVSFEFGCQALRRVRAVVDNAGGGQTLAAEVTYTLFDAEDIV